jgi:hypothetical protein
MRDGERHGHGVMMYPNGAWYKGEWRNGRANGHGTVHFAYGGSYTGTWRDGCAREGEYMAWVDATEEECARK